MSSVSSLPSKVTYKKSNNSLLSTIYGVANLIILNIVLAPFSQLAEGSPAFITSSFETSISEETCSLLQVESKAKTYVKNTYIIIFNSYYLT